MITPSRRALSKGLLAAAALSPSGAWAQRGAVKPRIHLLLPLEGASAEVSAGAKDIADAARLALNDHAAGAPMSATLVVMDTLGDPEVAVAAATAGRSDGAQLVLGPVFATEARAVGRAVPDLPVISFSNDRSIGRRGLYVFGFQPEDGAAVIATHAARTGFGPLSVFGPSGPLQERVRASLARTDARWCPPPTPPATR
jgi:outer membrane PBP1 activator LpoA protein